MTFRDRYSEVFIPHRVSGPKLVHTAGYVPIRKRIDMMVRAGLALQHHPFFQYPDGTPTDKVVPVNTRSLDLSDVEKAKSTLLKNQAEMMAQNAFLKQQEARSAIEKAAIENYLKTHPIVAPEAPTT